MGVGLKFPVHCRLDLQEASLDILAQRDFFLPLGSNSLVSKAWSLILNRCLSSVPRGSVGKDHM